MSNVLLENDIFGRTPCVFDPRPVVYSPHHMKSTNARPLARSARVWFAYLRTRCIFNGLRGCKGRTPHNLAPAMPAVLPRFAAINALWIEAGAILARRLEKRRVRNPQGCIIQKLLNVTAITALTALDASALVLGGRAGCAACGAALTGPRPTKWRRKSSGTRVIRTRPAA